MRVNNEQEQGCATVNKLPKPQPLTRAEKRAAKLDVWVKQDIAERRAADAAKKSRLRELRMAREALQVECAANSAHVDCPPKPQVQRIKPQVQKIWISGPEAKNYPVGTKRGDES